MKIAQWFGHVNGKNMNTITTRALELQVKNNRPKEQTRSKCPVLTEMKIQVMVLGVVMLHSDVVGYQHFEGTCFFHLQGEVIRAWKCT